MSFIYGILPLPLGWSLPLAGVKATQHIFVVVYFKEALSWQWTLGKNPQGSADVSVYVLSPHLYSQA